MWWEPDLPTPTHGVVSVLFEDWFHRRVRLGRAHRHGGDPGTGQGDDGSADEGGGESVRQLGEVAVLLGISERRHAASVRSGLAL